MREITLGNKKTVDVLNVTIGDAVYSVPLMGSMKLKDASRLDTQERIMAFFLKYIPKKVMEDLTVDDVNALINAWSAESEKNGAKPGEL